MPIFDAGNIYFTNSSWGYLFLPVRVAQYMGFDKDKESGTNLLITGSKPHIWPLENPVVFVLRYHRDTAGITSSNTA
jgi:hypothetical protein